MLINPQPIVDVLAEILKYLGRMSTDNRDKITDGAGYSRSGGFFLYVGTEGNVTYTKIDGTSATEFFTAGYHPTKFIAIGTSGAGTTATNLAACF